MKIELKKHPKTKKVIAEEWKVVIGSNNKYLISNYGRLMWMTRDCGYKFMSLCNDKDGYKMVGLRMYNLTRRMKRVHRLVAEAFLPNLKSLKIVHHKDNDVTNNFYLNLEWCTNKQNLQYMFDQGRNTPTKGIINGMSKLSEKDVLYMRSHLKGETYQSIADIMEISKGQAHHIMNRNSWKHI